MHLDEVQLVDLAVDRGDAVAAAHVEGCPTCAAALDRWRHAIHGLQVIERAFIDDDEMHRLKTLFTVCGPSPNRMKSWAARLIRSSTKAAVVGVRGRSGNELREYAAGPHVILMQLVDDGRSGWTVHGQVLAGDAPASFDGEFVMTDADGRGATTPIDLHGEFHCSGLPSGRYAVTWWVDSNRIDEPDLVLGDES